MSGALPAPRDPRSPVAFWAVLGGLWLFLAVIAWLAPIQGDDWLPMYWIGQHGGGPLSVLEYTTRHRTIGDLASILLVTAPLVHVVLSPTIVVTLMVGVLAVARGAIPRPRDRDAALLLAVTSTMIWIGAPRAGLDFFYRPYLAHFVYGLTAVVWLLYLVIHRLEAPRGPGATVAIGALALCAGTSNHYVAPVLLFVLWRRIRGVRDREPATSPARSARARAQPPRGPVPTWLWVAFGATALGALILFTNRPYLPLGAIARGGFEHNVFRLYLFMGQCGELVALLMIVFFAIMVRARFAPLDIALADPRGIALAGRAYGTALIIAVLAVFSPRWGEPAMLAPVVALTVAGLTLLEPSWRYRPLRTGAIIAAVIVHGLVVVTTVPRYLRAKAEFDDRMAAIAATPAGGIAHIAPYRKTEQDAWFYGDDLMATRIRGRVAVTFGLRAIDYTSPFGRLERSAGYTFVERWGDETVPLLTDDLEVARSLFGDHVRTRTRDLSEPGPATLELTDGLDWPGRNGRRLIAATYDDVEDEIVVPDFDFTPLDRKQRFSLELDADSLPGSFPQAVVASSGESIPFTTDGDDHWVFPPRSDRYALLRCNDRECWVAMAIWNAL